MILNINEDTSPGKSSDLPIAMEGTDNEIKIDSLSSPLIENVNLSRNGSKTLSINNSLFTIENILHGGTVKKDSSNLTPKAHKFSIENLLKETSIHNKTPYDNSIYYDTCTNSYRPTSEKENPPIYSIYFDTTTNLFKPISIKKNSSNSVFKSTPKNSFKPMLGTGITGNTIYFDTTTNSFKPSLETDTTENTIYYDTNTNSFKPSSETGTPENSIYFDTTANSFKPVSEIDTIENLTCYNTNKRFFKPMGETGSLENSIYYDTTKILYKPTSERNNTNQDGKDNNILDSDTFVKKNIYGETSLLPLNASNESDESDYVTKTEMVFSEEIRRLVPTFHDGRPLTKSQIEGLIMAMGGGTKVVSRKKRTKTKNKLKKENKSPQICPRPGCDGTGNIYKEYTHHRTISRCPRKKLIQKDSNIANNECLKLSNDGRKLSKISEDKFDMNINSMPFDNSHQVDKSIGSNVSEIVINSDTVRYSDIKQSKSEFNCIGDDKSWFSLRDILDEIENFENNLDINNNTKPVENVIQDITDGTSYLLQDSHGTSFIDFIVDINKDNTDQKNNWNPFFSIENILQETKDNTDNLYDNSALASTKVIRDDNVFIDLEENSKLFNRVSENSIQNENIPKNDFDKILLSDESESKKEEKITNKSELHQFEYSCHKKDFVTSDSVKNISSHPDGKQTKRSRIEDLIEKVKSRIAQEDDIVNPKRQKIIMNKDLNGNSTNLKVNSNSRTLSSVYYKDFGPSPSAVAEQEKQYRILSKDKSKVVRKLFDQDSDIYHKSYLSSPKDKPSYLYSYLDYLISKKISEAKVEEQGLFNSSSLTDQNCKNPSEVLQQDENYSKITEKLPKRKKKKEKTKKKKEKKDKKKEKCEKNSENRGKIKEKKKKKKERRDKKKTSVENQAKEEMKERHKKDKEQKEK